MKVKRESVCRRTKLIIKKGHQVIQIREKIEGKKVTLRNKEKSDKLIGRWMEID